VRAMSDESLDGYRERFAAVDSLTGLLALGEAVHAHERTSGNVAVMAQLMAGAQQDEVLARAARYAMEVLREEVEVVVRRVLETSPLADLVESAGLARAISAAFIGLELYEGVDAKGGAAVASCGDRLAPMAR
jgi:hypothetical protein